MIKDILNLINKSNTILLLTHENPDGDAIGSLLALCNWLSNFKKVLMVMPEVPPIYDYLKNRDLILEKSNDEFDLAIVVDCSSIGRIGQNNNEFYRCDKSIIIDHHVSNEMYGSINYIDKTCPSCAQLIYYLFKNWNIQMTKEIGECLLTGSITDTNGFSNSNVNKDTFLMTADLLNYDISLHELYYNLLLKKSMAQFELMKMATQRLEFFGNNRVVFSYISHEDMENVGAKKGDHEGLVDIGRNIMGVDVSIFMREDDGYNVSFRSNGVDVEKIAKRFGGGGHKVAAGAKLAVPFKEAKDALIRETLKELDIDGWDNSNQ